MAEFLSTECHDQSVAFHFSDGWQCPDGDRLGADDESLKHEFLLISVSPLVLYGTSAGRDLGPVLAVLLFFSLATDNIL